MAWWIHRGLRRALVPRGLNSSSPLLRPPAASSPYFSSLQSRSQENAAPESGIGGSTSSKTASFRSSLNPTEVAKFAAIAETWWDSQGPFKPLHLMNPTRVSFIRSTLCRHFRKDPFSVRPFEGLKIIDVGCGGGILSEPLARMGATVTGIDAVEKNIKIADIHAALDPLTSSIEYHCTTAA
ncbi:hypothetical protein ZIOFF_062441 [Zingiber officinale]|uniref:Methyltransferase type 11 domain-containing protein n=1 Tax=Zingiber officinale TaxID=94328 RepID=A0A8J5KAS8_ZINOF|nr:hypothetical protein ZIOFF_062441 [Zingiber officinale]